METNGFLLNEKCWSSLGLEMLVNQARLCMICDDLSDPLQDLSSRF